MLTGLQVLTGLAICLGALAQGVAGLGFGLLCAPLLIGVYGPAEGVRQVVFLSLLLNAAVLAREYRSVRVWEALGLLLPALMVTPVVAAMLRRSPAHLLLAAAGALTLLSVLLLASGLRLHRLRGWTGALVAGGVSAAMNVLGGLAGPAAALYAVGANWPPQTISPTLQLYGVGLNVVTLLSVGMPHLQAPLLLDLGLGTLLGLVLAPLVPPAVLRTLILVLATAGGLLVFWRGVS